MNVYYRYYILFAPPPFLLDSKVCHFLKTGALLLMFAAVASELRGKWEENRRSSSDINVSRWEQLKHMLQSGKNKVEFPCVTQMLI